jgi:DNA-binding GntR family transcriptional regulator
VEVGYRRQVAVRAVSAKERREVFLVREALERVAVIQACRVMPLEEIDYLRLLIMRQTRAADAGNAIEFIDLDEEFHQKIASGADLPIVVKFLNNLRAFIRLFGIEAISHSGRAKVVLAEHEKIVDALEARDEERAVDAIVSHLRDTAAALDSVERDAKTARKADGRRTRTKPRHPSRSVT